MPFTLVSQGSLAPWPLRHAHVGSLGLSHRWPDGHAGSENRSGRQTLRGVWL